MNASQCAHRSARVNRLLNPSDSCKVVMKTSPAIPCVFTTGRDEAFPRIEDTVKKLEPGKTATVRIVRSG